MMYGGSKKKMMMYGGKKKMMKKGGLKMVMKDGKMVPFYAADGKGKMEMGGEKKINVPAGESVDSMKDRKKTIGKNIKAAKKKNRQDKRAANKAGRVAT